MKTVRLGFLLGQEGKTLGAMNKEQYVFDQREQLLQMCHCNNKQMK